MALALAPQDAAQVRQGGEARRFVDYLITDGVLPGEIAALARGSHGFGYDPVFIEAASKRTLAEMTLAEKNQTSHRYRALIEMRELMLRMRLVRETR